MAQNEFTLFDYLQHANPRIRSRCRKGKNTTMKSSSIKSWLTCPQYIEEWDDFGLSSLDAACGGSLREELARRYRLREHPEPPEFPFCEIHDEDSFTSLLILWNWPIVSSALAAAQEESLKHPSGEAVYMVRGGQALYPGGESDSRPRPDWAGVRRPSRHSGVLPRTIKGETIIPGDTKLSSKWQSALIPRELDDGVMKKEWFKPIGQIYQYCLYANARYGYVISDLELLVVRVDLQISDDGIGTTLRYKSIPWDNHRDAAEGDPDVMTINLALWLLHLAAAWDSRITTDEKVLERLLEAHGKPSVTSGPLPAQHPTTPSRNASGGRNAIGDHSMSFRAGTSDVGHLLAGASIGDDGSGLSPTPSKKRGIDLTSGEESTHRRGGGDRPSKKRHRGDPRAE